MTVSTEESLSRAFKQYPDAVVLGEGSNTVFSSDVDRPIIRPLLRGIEANGEVLQIAAGENWHDLVMRASSQNLGGIENLALIPGSVGAAPVQNIGAYGQELADVLTGVRVYERSSGKFRHMTAAECEFGYRDSVFKRPGGGENLVIVRVELQLNSQFSPNLDHADLADCFSRAKPGHPGEVARAVIAIRKNKLPDPAVTGNAGSYFKNPIVSDTVASILVKQHPGLPRWSAGNGHSKLSAGWLIEHSRLKGTQVGDVAVSEQHALVLVNLGLGTPGDLAALSQQVVETVYEHYGVQLEREPVLI